MINKIAKFQLKCGTNYLYAPSNITAVPLSEAESNVVDWWKTSPQDFKDKVKKPIEKKQDIEAVGFLIDKVDGVTIFSSQLNEINYVRGAQVVSDTNIVKITTFSRKKAASKPKLGDPVLIEWTDSAINFKGATIEQIKKSKGVLDIKRVGIFLHMNRRRIYTASRLNREKGIYRELLAIPMVNVKKIYILK